MNEFRSITINGIDLNGICKDYRCNNTLEYAEEVERLNDFTLDNMSIDAAYIPKVEFVFAKVSIAEYRTILQNVNQKSFTVNYYDYTLGKIVTRTMYLDASDIERLYIVCGNIEDIIGFTVTFISRVGYDEYGDL